MAFVDDVCHLLDADGLVVVAPVDAVIATGAAPTGVSRSALRFTHEGSLWRARALIDV